MGLVFIQFYIKFNQINSMNKVLRLEISSLSDTYKVWKSSPLGFNFETNDSQSDSYLYSIDLFLHNLALLNCVVLYQLIISNFNLLIFFINKWYITSSKNPLLNILDKWCGRHLSIEFCLVFVHTILFLIFNRK